jgi:hypothetical protein
MTPEQHLTEFRKLATKLDNFYVDASNVANGLIELAAIECDGEVKKFHYNLIVWLQLRQIDLTKKLIKRYLDGDDNAQLLINSFDATQAACKNMLDAIRAEIKRLEDNKFNDEFKTYMQNDSI